MPYLKLLDKGSQKTYRVDSSDAVVGRDPACAIFVEGDAAKTVSGHHARFSLDDGAWYVEDVGSRNGTFVAGQKLDPGTRRALANGDIIALGLTGTQLLVQEAVGRAFAATMLEAAPAGSAAMAAGTTPMRRPDAPRAGVNEAAGDGQKQEVRLVLRSVQFGTRVVGQSERITLGRALECLIRVEGEAATSVSRIHADVVPLFGVANIRDGSSRHGTFVNNKKLAAPHPLKHGDLIMLGPGGPTFSVDEASVVAAGSPPPVGASVASTTTQTSATGRKSTTNVPGRKPASADEVFESELPTPAVARPAARAGDKNPKPAAAAPSASPATKQVRATLGGGSNRTFARDAVNQALSPNAKRMRMIAGATVVVVAGAVGAAILYGKRSPRTDANADGTPPGIQQAASLDSLKAAATSGLAATRASFDSAVKAGAQASVLDSLRGAIVDANNRAKALEESSRKAKTPPRG